jgi:hypothetical protein
MVGEWIRIRLYRSLMPGDTHSSGNDVVGKWPGSGFKMGR